MLAPGDITMSYSIAGGLTSTPLLPTHSTSSSAADMDRGEGTSDRSSQARPGIQGSEREKARGALYILFKRRGVVGKPKPAGLQLELQNSILPQLRYGSPSRYLVPPPSSTPDIAGGGEPVGQRLGPPAGLLWA